MKYTLLILFLLASTIIFSQTTNLTIKNGSECTIKQATVLSVGPCGLVENKQIITLEPLQSITYKHTSEYELWIKHIDLESHCSKQKGSNSLSEYKREEGDYYVWKRGFKATVFILTGDAMP